VITLVCSRCGERKELPEGSLYNNAPIAEWWDSVGRLCAACRKLPPEEPKPRRDWNDEVDITRNYHGGSETSVEAHDSLTNAAADRKRIVAWVGQRQDGGICEEAEFALGLSHQTCSARFSELKARNELFTDGTKRKTSSGRNAFVHYVVKHGQQAPATPTIGD
jgi:hypothetical protein